MPGILYLILAGLLGKELAGLLFYFQKDGRGTGGNRLWLVLPISFGTGTLVLTWTVYLIAWGYSIFVHDNPLFYGNLAGMCGAALLLALIYVLRYVGRRNGRYDSCRTRWISCRKLFVRELVFFVLLGIFFLWILYYVFFISGGVLYCGATVFGDYAPHVSMIRSFSREANFPTQYPHFGGADVKYHFMFQFLVGNLEYLGLPLDLAYNLVSALALEGFFMLLYMLAGRITGSRACGVLGTVLVIFRSGLTFFRYVWEHLQAGDLRAVLEENTAFIGYTPNEDWGLWNFNVYLNQRHLAFGMLLAAIALWFYLDWVEASAAREEKGLLWFRDRFFSREAWKFRNPGMAVLLGMILGMGAFWNGAAVIGGLLILMGFGIFSDGKMDYALSAAVAVVLSCAQSAAFIRGGAVSFSVYWGFLAENKSIPGVLWYLLQMSGVFFLGLAVLIFFLERRQRILLVSFLFPLFFALGFSLTPDINVNHKYIMISYAFLTMFWAWVIVRAWLKKFPGKILAVCLTVCLTLTGIYDFVIILRNNGTGHRVSVSMESPVTEWIVENLDAEDLMLTPEYSIHEVTVSGVMMYLGWPYYGWSAGYDTYYRAAKAVTMYTTGDKEELMRTVEEEGITYILFEEGMEFEQRTCREDIIAECYPLVYQSDDGRIRIYET